MNQKIPTGNSSISNDVTDINTAEILLESVLENLNSSNKDICLTMVVTLDGLIISSRGNVTEPDKVGALYTELQSLCEKIMTELKYGKVEEMFIRSESGCIILLPAGNRALLACLTTSDVNLNLVLLKIWRAANTISKIL